LALLLKDYGELDAARPLYERALAINDRALGPEHPSTAAVRAHLEDLHQERKIAGVKGSLHQLFSYVLPLGRARNNDDRTHAAVPRFRRSPLLLGHSRQCRPQDGHTSEALIWSGVSSSGGHSLRPPATHSQVVGLWAAGSASASVLSRCPTPRQKGFCDSAYPEPPRAETRCPRPCPASAV